VKVRIGIAAILLVRLMHSEVLDEHGERVLDEAGNYVFNAVPTTDWGKPETLEAWRQAWADLCNAKFAEKGLDCRIDHRSFARQGVEQIPTQHEGPTVRAMEAKGIRTNKGDLNRVIRKTNALMREAKEKIAALIGWLRDVKAELAKPQPPISSICWRCIAPIATRARTAIRRRTPTCSVTPRRSVFCNPKIFTPWTIWKLRFTPCRTKSTR